LVVLPGPPPPPPPSPPSLPSLLLLCFTDLCVLFLPLLLLPSSSSASPCVCVCMYVHTCTFMYIFYVYKYAYICICMYIHVTSELIHPFRPHAVNTSCFCVLRSFCFIRGLYVHTRTHKDKPCPLCVSCATFWQYWWQSASACCVVEGLW
jgi:hypothetical protein